MLKIIINSYTCCPGMGSEPGMGWNWIVHLAKYCELYVISEGEYRDQCEKASEGLPIHWYWNPVSPEVRKMCWNQGDWRFYKYYEQWQRKTAETARDILREIGNDRVVLHQLNMIGFREPGYLWKVSKETGVPFVWGPVDAKEGFPLSYTDGASIKNKLFLFLKNSITRFQLKYSGRVIKAANQASVVIGASSNSVSSFQKYMNIHSVLINETGCGIANESTHGYNNPSHPGLSMLWVGKFDFRKQLVLAIKTISILKDKDIVLHIVGAGNADEYRLLAQEYDIENKICWHGEVTHEQVQSLMSQSDMLLFTSVAEGTPHVVLEAIANGLPVLCFDTCGQGDVITPDVGIKIPLSTPSQSIHDFADKIRYLYDHPEELQRMSHNCKKRAEELSWENKAKKMVELYESVVK